MRNGLNGIMGNGLGQLSNEAYLPGKMPVTADQALKTAQIYLDKAYPGVQPIAKADEYPGYYIVDLQKQGLPELETPRSLHSACVVSDFTRVITSSVIRVQL